MTGTLVGVEGGRGALVMLGTYPAPEPHPQAPLVSFSICVTTVVLIHVKVMYSLFSGKISIVINNHVHIFLCLHIQIFVGKIPRKKNLIVKILYSTIHLIFSTLFASGYKIMPYFNLY